MYSKCKDLPEKAKEAVCHQEIFIDEQEEIEKQLSFAKMQGENRLHKEEQLHSKTNHGFKSNFKLLKKWEGYIESINVDEIVAKLFDEEDNSYDIYEFSLEEVKEDDKNLVKRGALFFLYLGYYTNERGTRMRSSKIKFRRFPVEDEDFINQGLDAINELDFNDIWE